MIAANLDICKQALCSIRETQRINRVVRPAPRVSTMELTGASERIQAHASYVRSTT